MLLSLTKPTLDGEFFGSIHNIVFNDTTYPNRQRQQTTGEILDMERAIQFPKHKMKAETKKA